MNAYRSDNESVDEAKSLQDVLPGLSDPDRDVRQRVALAVGEQADSAAIPALLTQLWTEMDFFVRETLTWAVARIGSEAIPAIRDALAQNNPAAVRTQALHLLSKIADPATVNDIAALVNDPDVAVSTKARWALARVGDPCVLPVLVNLLGCGDTEAQNALTDVLATFGPEAVPTLSEALSDDSSAVRRHAADVLGYIGHPHAESAAVALGELSSDPDSDVAVSALMALGTMNGHNAKRSIEHATGSSNPRVRAVAERLAARAPKISRLEAARAARAARQAASS